MAEKINPPISSEELTEAFTKHVETMGVNDWGRPKVKLPREQDIHTFGESVVEEYHRPVAEPIKSITAMPQPPKPSAQEIKEVMTEEKVSELLQEVTYLRQRVQALESELYGPVGTGKNIIQVHHIGTTLLGLDMWRGGRLTMITDNREINSPHLPPIQQTNLKDFPFRIEPEPRPSMPDVPFVTSEYGPGIVDEFLKVLLPTTLQLGEEIEKVFGKPSFIHIPPGKTSVLKPHK